ncbi:MAG TPA: hypothetical protein VMU51_33550 [Mycobacteriales bacterium]|nr:hypothetical protein [Mycobacteriales bacterium]
MRIVWLFPDRGTIRENRADEANFWSGYRRVGGELGCVVETCSPELVDMRYAPGGRLEVFLDGAPVTPADAVFVTEFWTFPHMVRDVWSSLTVAHLLAEAGFYLPISPQWSVRANDKLLTVARLAPLLRHASVLPTARITTGRDLEERGYAGLLREIGFPAVVKPASWAAQQGIVVVRDEVELICALRLASAADLPVVVQRRLDPQRLVSYRMFGMDGEVLATRRYAPVPGHVLIGARLGGTDRWVDAPPELVEDAERVMAAVPTSFLCLDFLAEDERYYLSEIELDAGIGVQMMADHPRAAEVLRRRLASYLCGHRRWLDRPADPAPSAPPSPGE